MKSKIKFVCLIDIRFDPVVQRALSTMRVKKMAGNFVEAAVGTPVLSQREDGYYILDGQHRIETLRLVYGENGHKVRCEVFEDLPVEEEAKLFLLRNEKTNVKAYDKFRCRVTAKEPAAVAITHILKAVGLTLSDQSGVGHVNAVAALERVYQGKRFRSGGEHPEILRQTLDLLKRAWNSDPRAYDGLLIDALGAFLLRYDEDVDNARLLKRMRQYPGGAAGIIRDGRAMKETLRIGKVRDAISNLFVNSYNKLLRTRHLDVWRG